MVALADPRASRVVLIGGAHYRHLPEVPAVARNLSGLTGVVTDADLWGVAAEHCRAVLDASDPGEVSRTVRQAAAEVQPDGLLLVYYAGHGLVDPFDGSLVLALHDTDPAVPYEAGLPYEFIRRAVSASPAQRRVVVLDCCYAGRASGVLAAEETGTKTVADRAEIEQTCLLVSAPRNRTAQAPQGAPYTAFTGELLRVLRGGANDRPAVLDVRAVWQEVARLLRARGFELPELRAGNAGDTIGLVRNAARQHRDLVGRILVADVSVDDRDLHQAAVLVLRHDRAKGAVGVRINTPTSWLSKDVPPGWRRLLTEPAVVFDAGPLSRNEGFIAVARLRPESEPPLRFRPLRDRLGVIALSTDPELLAPVLSGLRLFSGYLGWGPGQLEADLDAGLLLLADRSADAREVLSTRPRELWTTLHARARGGAG
jgi:putative transcriptional regulator